MRIVTLVISAVALMPGVTVPNAIAGFIEDSKANLTLRNFYINTDNRSGDGFSKQEEWGQGFILNYDSGYTEGPVGFGLSTLGLLGIRLDGGGKAGSPASGRQPGTVFPLDNDGRAVHQFGSLGVTGRAKISDTELRYGTLQPKNPVVIYNDARLLPMTYQGGQISSTDIDDLSLTGGVLTHTKGRNSTDMRGMSIAGANGSGPTSRSSNRFYFAGGDYTLMKDMTLSYYYGELDNFYRQNYIGLAHNLKIVSGNLKSDIRIFISDADGKNGSAAGRSAGYVSTGYYGNNRTKGEVDNNVYSGQLTWSSGGHSVSSGYQWLTGKSDFPYLNRGDGEGTSTWLITDAQLLKFSRAGERTWLARYAYNFADAGLKGLNLSILYLNADNIDTGDGRKGEWERDIALSYTIPEGILNGLGISVKNATMRSALPDTSRKGSAGQRDQDETRVTVSYTLPLL